MANVVAMLTRERLNLRLSGDQHATIRPHSVKKPVTMALSSDVLERFTATGEGWEARVDAALRQWLEEHPKPVEHAKAS